LTGSYFCTTNGPAAERLVRIQTIGTVAVSVSVVSSIATRPPCR